jgi:hypothetical protein
MRKIVILSSLISASVVLIVVGIIGRSQIGDLPSILTTQFGAILLGLSISQIFFSFLTLPDIVDKTIFVTHGLDDPIKATSHLSNRSDQRVALNSIVKFMCGKSGLGSEDLVKNVVDFVDKHSQYGFLRQNYRLMIELLPLPETGTLAAVRDRYYQAKYTASYDVANVCGEKKPYRVKFMLDNHDYDGISHDIAIVISVFKSTKTKIDNGTAATPKDYLPVIDAKCPGKLRPLVASEATVFLDLSNDADPAKKAILDEILTEKIEPNEKLKIESQYTLYLRKQDLHEISMKYFTKGIMISLIAPKKVHASFIERYEATPTNVEPTTLGNLTTWIWGTEGFVFPHEGGTIYWHTTK